MPKSQRRLNINFRHSSRDFSAARQASVWSNINRNLPYKIFHVSKEVFLKGKSKLRNVETEKQKNK